MSKLEDTRQKALDDLGESGVLMREGHFDYGNGYHGSVYLNPHQLFRRPSTIWRFAQDLLDVLPATVVSSTQVVVGPVTGGALLAHTIAGLLDSRRSLTHPSCFFAPFHISRSGGFLLRSFYGSELKGKRILLADDVRNTGQTLAQCAALVKEVGGELIATAEIYDRGNPLVALDVPNYALATFEAPENYPANGCPLCKSGMPITSF
ncbi:MAG TPA: phosphoribosyltransferase family protein [Vicinamibacterales bacterium]|nr:phosphoribosyltransferase family protein [Vicinamibacterales bacterium]